MRPTAKAVRHAPGVMNRLESAYAQHLRERQFAGDVAWFAFESVTLKLADGCRFTPDFLVTLADGTLEAHETKGFMRDDAAVKLKVAASLFPFRFVLVVARAKKDGGGWTRTLIGEPGEYGIDFANLPF